MDIRETIRMLIMEQGETMISLGTRNDKQLRLLSLISMLPQLWLDHKIIVTILQAAMKPQTQETLWAVFQIWQLCLNHTVT